MQLKIKFSEEHAIYIQNKSNELGIPPASIVKILIGQAIKGTPTTTQTARTSKPENIQEGAKFIITPAKLRDLEKCEAVHFDDARGAINTAFYSQDNKKRAAEGQALNGYDFQYFLCPRDEFDNLAPAIKTMINEKAAKWYTGKTKEQLQAERDSVTFFKK